MIWRQKKDIKDKIQGEKLPDDDEQFFINNKGNIVLTAGRLVDQKGQWHLIRAFSRVINKMPDAKLLILGQGGNKDYLERLIKDYKLEDSIKLLGYKSNPYIYMVRSDIFAFSSVYEGLGNILVECMACGLPVVSADYKYGAKKLLAPDMDLKTEIHEVTYGKYGILVPEMDDKKYEAIVAYRACVTRSFDESKILIGGVGGRILKHNVEWVH